MNTSDENYLVTLLESVVHLRKNLKLELLARGVERAWITECAKELFPPGTTLGTKSDTVALLRDVFASGKPLHWDLHYGGICFCLCFRCGEIFLLEGFLLSSWLSAAPKSHHGQPRSWEQQTPPL